MTTKAFEAEIDNTIDIANAVDSYRAAVKVARQLRAELHSARQIVVELEARNVEAREVASKASQELMCAARGDDDDVPIATWFL